MENMGFVVKVISSGTVNCEVVNPKEHEDFFDEMNEIFYVPSLNDANEIINILNKSRQLMEIKIHGHLFAEALWEDELWEE